jgi:hypothetical protein
MIQYLCWSDSVWNLFWNEFFYTLVFSIAGGSWQTLKQLFVRKNIRARRKWPWAGKCLCLKKFSSLLLYYIFRLIRFHLTCYLLLLRMIWLKPLMTWASFSGFQSRGCVPARKQLDQVERRSWRADVSKHLLLPRIRHVS